MRVFLSYSRVDSAPALAIADDLRRNGLEVWLDQRDIPVSVPWLEEIEAAIRGAALMLVLDSDHWRASENCQAELSIAERWSVSQVRVRSADTVVGDVLIALAQRTPEDAVRTELFVRAGDWASHGHPRGALVSGRTLGRYAAVAQRNQARLPREVSEFIGTCYRRQRRRKVLSKIGVLSAIALIIGGIATYGALGLTNSSIDTAIESMDNSARYDVLYQMNPYSHLDYLARAADVDSWLVDLQFARGFSGLLPQQVVDAENPDAARLVPPSQIGVMSALGPDGTSRAEVATGSTLVITDEVTGETRRVLTAGSRPSTIAWSPDGSWLAVGTGSDVELLDVRHGNSSQILRGSTGRVTGLSVTGSMVNALTDAPAVVSWPTPFASSLLSGAGWVMDAESVPGGDEVAVLDRSGILVLIDAKDRLEKKRIDTGLTGDDSLAVTMAINPAGTEVAVIGRSRSRPGASLLLIDLATGQVANHLVDACNPIDLAYREGDAEIIFACGDAGVGVFDVSGHRQTVVQQAARVSSVATGGGIIAAGSDTGGIHILDQSLNEIGRGFAECPQEVRPVRFAPDGRYVFHGGTSVGSMTCAIRGSFGSGAMSWDHFIFSGQQAHESRALAVSPNGALVAFGFADGTVRIYGVELMQPVAVVRPFSGEVRGLAFGGSGDTLTIATRDGDVAVEPVHFRIQNLEDKRAQAKLIVDRAVSLGLYKR